MDIDSDPMVRAQERYGRRIFDEVLHLPYRKPDWCLFGNWHWNVKLTKKQQDKAYKILLDAYNVGDIRYANVDAQ